MNRPKIVTIRCSDRNRKSARELNNANEKFSGYAIDNYCVIKYQNSTLDKLLIIQVSRKLTVHGIQGSWSRTGKIVPRESCDVNTLIP